MHSIACDRSINDNLSSSFSKPVLHQCARQLLLALIYSFNAMKFVKVGKVLTEVETC